MPGHAACLTGSLCLDSVLIHGKPSDNMPSSAEQIFWPHVIALAAPNCIAPSRPTFLTKHCVTEPLKLIMSSTQECHPHRPSPRFWPGLHTISWR